MKKCYLLVCLFALIAQGARTNNVALANISLTDQNFPGHFCNIKFDISWENSWRTATSIPLNWDACWVFAKYRVSNGPWHHCTLSTTAGQHFAPSGSAVAPSSDGKGIFIYRDTDGNGSVNWTNVKLRWNYGDNGIADDAVVEVKLFAIEMIYLPEGPFYIGDGDGTNESTFSLHQGIANSALQVTSALVQNVRVNSASTYDDGQIKNPGIGIDGDGGLDINNDGIVENTEFPTGYKAYYIMKYEISQEQYMEFLNTLTRAQQGERVQSDISMNFVNATFVMENDFIPFHQNGIRCDNDIPDPPEPVTFYCDLSTNHIQELCDGQYLPCNLLSWQDGTAYADWSGLRPMSELEFEKATRGINNPVYGEFAWGNTSICDSLLSRSLEMCPNSNIITVPNVNIGRATYYYSDGMGDWMERCGLFAASSVNHTRQEAGAGYYGVMELSGNLSEPVVNIGTIAGRSYRAIHGNGELNIAGFADVDYWPGINGNSNSGIANAAYGGTTGVTESAGSGGKGGHLWSTASNLRISDRISASLKFSTVRESINGHRFVRNAP